MALAFIVGAGYPFGKVAEPAITPPGNRKED